MEGVETEREMDVDETEPERSPVVAPGSKDKEDPKSSFVDKVTRYEINRAMWS